MLPYSAQHFGLEQIGKSKKPQRQQRASAMHTTNTKTQALYKKMAAYNTVGAVALDTLGTLAAGASTGGVSMMLPGRVGDSPLIGSGVYADNEAGARFYDRFRREYYSIIHGQAYCVGDEERGKSLCQLHAKPCNYS